MADATPRQQTTETLAKLYNGKLRLEHRNGVPRIYARTYIQGKNVVRSTGERTLDAATSLATDWYLELRDRARRGEHLHGRSFAEMAEAFIVHANQIREVSEGQRRNYREKWNLLKEHFDGVKITDVDARFLLALREKRSQARTRNGAPVKPATLKKDMDFVRLVLRHAKHIDKCLDELPEFPSFRGEAWEVVPSPRPFLNYEQWVKLRKLGWPPDRGARRQARCLDWDGAAAGHRVHEHLTPHIPAGETIGSIVSRLARLRPTIDKRASR